MAEKIKRIVVIGAGIGGSGVATLLQARGHQVTLLEKNPFWGGKCISIERDGFLVDHVLHIFGACENGPHGEITRRINGDLRWVVHNPLGTGYLVGKKSGYINLPQATGAALPELVKSYSILRPQILHSLYHSVRNFGFKGLIETVIKLARADEGFFQSLDDISMYDFLSRFTEDPVIHRLFASYSFISFVIPYTEASAGELLWCVAYMTRNKSLGYPKGGAQEISNSYIRAFKKNGGIVRTGCAVKRIIIKDGKARGVETVDGEEIKADVVISNAGIKGTLDLAGEKHYPEEYVSYVNALRYCNAGLVTRMGLDCTLEDLPKNIFMYFPDHDAKTMGDFLDERRIPEDAGFCITVPTDWDPSLAPLGKQIIVLGSMGPSEVSPDNTSFCNRILDATEQKAYAFFPQLEKHVEWKMRTCPDSIAKLTGRPTGDCIGLSQCVGQTGVKKPSPITPIKDLWLVGTDAGARGLGTEQAAGSALYVANLLG